MRRYHKIIFVCEDNTATSVMAEMICKSMVTDESVTIESRGMVVLFPEPVNPKVDVVLINHGLALEERTTRMLEVEDVDEETLILTMNGEQKEKILRMFDNNVSVYTMYGFIDEEVDMMDPYGGSLLDYDECFITMSTVVKKIVIKLKRTYGLQDTETVVE